MIMSREEITGTVIETVAEVLNINASELNENTNPQQEFGADSIDFVEILVSLEEKLDIDFPDKVVAGTKFDTIADITQFVEPFVKD